LLRTKNNAPDFKATVRLSPREGELIRRYLIDMGALDVYDRLDQDDVVEWVAQVVDSALSTLHD
jgi:hypothetical protein